MNRRRDSGFTLYELMITVLVIGVILSLGIPNLQEFTANSRISSTANDLHSAFMVARTEAARTKENVTICASANGATCGSTDFDDGWIVFVDTGPTSTPAGTIGTVDAADTVVRQYPAVHDSIDINATDINDVAADSFTFAPTGMGLGNAGAVSAATICDARGNQVSAGGWSSARVLIVTPLGRSTVLRDSVQIANQGGCP